MEAILKQLLLHLVKPILGCVGRKLCSNFEEQL